MPRGDGTGPQGQGPGTGKGQGGCKSSRGIRKSGKNTEQRSGSGKDRAEVKVPDKAGISAVFRKNKTSKT